MKESKISCGWLWCLWVLAGLLIAGCMGVTAKAKEDEWQILYINSYSYGCDGVQSQVDGIRENVGEDCQIQYEFMESEAFDEETAEAMFYNRMQYRSSQNRAADAAVVSGEAALRFVLKYRDEFFPDIPVVFLKVEEEALIQEAIQQPLVYGILYEPSIAANIELAQALNPDLTNMVAIVDSTDYGLQQTEQFLAQQEAYPKLTLSVINTSELSAIGVKRKVWHLSPANTALLYLCMTENNQGEQYTLAGGLAEICQFAKLPVMSMNEAWLDQGTAGGHVVCLYKSAVSALNLAISLIRGEVPENRLLPSPNEVNLDESVLRDFEVELSRIPKDAHILNHELTFWERNESAIRGAMFPCVILLMLAGVFVYENRRRKLTMLQMEEMNQKLMDSSQHDFLTQLPNRNKFTQDITNCVNAQIPCTVFMLDIDDFKKINDTMGHSAGDEVLQEISRRLKELESGSFTAYRFAGDEFTIIFKHTERSAVEVAAAKCRGVFDFPMEVRGEKRKVTGSIGVARYPEDAKDAEQLVVCADKAMYCVKKSGKNAFGMYEN